MMSSSNHVEQAPFKATLPGWLIAAAQIIITVGLPLLLVLINARLLMNNWYLQWEYNRPNFPPDPFGLSTEDRLTYAPLALAYLFNDAGSDFLADQTFPDGSPLYNEREIAHMVDVKMVTQGLVTFGLVLLGIYVVCIGLLAANPANRPALLRALLAGSILTVALIITGLVVTATSFDWLFTQFHALFFEGDSWIFEFSDTLIRLFPLQFWIDAFVLMFGGALLEAIMLGLIVWMLLRRRATHRPGG